MAVWRPTDETNLIPLRVPFGTLADSIDNEIAALESRTGINTYLWATQDEQDAQTGMGPGDLGYRLDTRDIWDYADGAWSNRTPPTTQSVTGASEQSITATAWANIPNLPAITLTLSRPTICDLRLGVWLAVNGAGDLRAGIAVTGPTPIGPASPNWGNVAYHSSIESTGAQGAIAQKVVTLGAGTHTIQGQAFGSGAARSVRYPNLTVTPVRIV